MLHRLEKRTSDQKTKPNTYISTLGSTSFSVYGWHRGMKRPMLITAQKNTRIITMGVFAYQLVEIGLFVCDSGVLGYSLVNGKNKYDIK
jgi:hypothetical protein